MKPMWLDKTEYPFTSRFFEVNGQNLHYIDEGRGEVLLFVHGTPSWSFDFRNVIKYLSSDYRCIAVDHIGFGLSDKPEDYDYSTQNHSKTLESFIHALDLKKISLIVHDFGGPIALNYAIHHAENIKNLIILNSWLWSSQNDPDFIKFSRVLKSPLLPFLYRYLNFSPRFILPMSFGDKKLPSRLFKQYTLPFPSARQRNGPLAFARSLLNDQEWFETLWDQRRSISMKPTLFIWGIKDKMIGQRYLDKFLSGFENRTAVKLTTCGHFPQEEESVQVSREIADFLNTGGSRLARE